MPVSFHLLLLSVQTVYNALTAGFFFLATKYTNLITELGIKLTRPGRARHDSIIKCAVIGPGKMSAIVYRFEPSNADDVRGCESRRRDQSGCQGW